MFPVLPTRQADQGVGSRPEWLAADDGQILFVRTWRGAIGKPVVIYMHGIEGHSQWFTPTAEHLWQSGMSVYALDRRGAGMNTSQRGHLSDYRQLMRDLQQLIAKVKNDHPQSAVFLMGNCWGAQPAIIFAQQYLEGQALSGLILTCPALKVKCDLTLSEKLAIAFSWLVGSRRTFAIPLTPEMFTDNSAYLEYVRHDPLRLTTATASFFVETLRLRREAFKSGFALKLPLLLLQAEQDQIVDVEGVCAWFEQLSLSDKTWHLCAGESHSLDFMSDASGYFDVLTNWIAAKSKVRTA